VKHWKPEGDVAALAPLKRRGKRARSPDKLTSWSLVDSYAPAPAHSRRKGELPGAVVGLALVAVGCAGICLLLYQLLGPRDTFAP